MLTQNRLFLTQFTHVEAINKQQLTNFISPSLFTVKHLQKLLLVCLAALVACAVADVSELKSADGYNYPPPDVPFEYLPPEEESGAPAPPPVKAAP